MFAFGTLALLVAAGIPFSGAIDADDENTVTAATTTDNMHKEAEWSLPDLENHAGFSADCWMSTVDWSQSFEDLEDGLLATTVGCAEADFLAAAHIVSDRVIEETLASEEFAKSQASCPTITPVPLIHGTTEEVNVQTSGLGLEFEAHVWSRLQTSIVPDALCPAWGIGVIVAGTEFGPNGAAVAVLAGGGASINDPSASSRTFPAVGVGVVQSPVLASGLITDTVTIPACSVDNGIGPPVDPSWTTDSRFGSPWGSTGACARIFLF